MSQKSKSTSLTSTSPPPLTQRELRSRSISQQSQPQQQIQHHQQQQLVSVMGNTQSNQQPQAQSPQLTRPLPQMVLETSITVPKLPPLQEILYGEEENKSEKEKFETIPIKSVVNMNDFLQVEGEEKLNLMMFAINKINTTFQYKLDGMTNILTDEEDGVFPRLRECEREIDEYKDRIDGLEEDNAGLVSDVKILKGVIMVQQDQIKDLQEKVTDLRMRSMASNIVIDGITQDVDDESVKNRW